MTRAERLAKTAALARASLCEVPHPVAVLEALLRMTEGLPGRSVDGCAHPSGGVGRPGQVGKPLKGRLSPPRCEGSKTCPHITST
jgi:hypothetical protein